MLLLFNPAENYETYSCTDILITYLSDSEHKVFDTRRKLYYVYIHVSVYLLTYTFCLKISTRDAGNVEVGYKV